MLDVTSYLLSLTVPSPSSISHTDVWNAMKIAVKFSRRFWPYALQGVICANSFIPVKKKLFFLKFRLFFFVWDTKKNITQKIFKYFYYIHKWVMLFHLFFVFFSQQEMWFNEPDMVGGLTPESPRVAPVKCDNPTYLVSCFATAKYVSYCFIL